MVGGGRSKGCHEREGSGGYLASSGWSFVGRSEWERERERGGGVER